jgi:ATP-dependent RNA helicase DHX8/PRP22
MSALIHFDGRLHLEAAKALENIDGKVLPGCLSWQKIKSQQLFHSTLIFSSPVYHVIKEQLEKVLASFKNLEGISLLCSFSFVDPCNSSIDAFSKR